MSIENFILEGNCLDIMKELIAQGLTVQSIVCDPPYGIAFMGRYWDSKDNIAFQSEVWRLCLDLLSPGGNLVAFGSTRTYHRLACAVEDAGFEIREQLAWVYGCLSKDTMLVTPNGLSSYQSIKPGDSVLCYDKYTGGYSYHPVEKIYEYNIKDTCYHLFSDHTDQIVSRNHRCIVERGGKEVFCFAEDLQKTEVVPFLEDVSDLQQSISNTYKGAGNKKQNLFKRMYETTDRCQEKSSGAPNRRTRWCIRSYLHRLWEVVLSSQMSCDASQKSSLQSPMQWYYSRRGMEKTCSQGAFVLDGENQNCNSKPMDGQQKPIMEGWYNLFTSERKLQGSAMHSMPGKFSTDGSQGWLCDGASVISSYPNQSIIDKDRGCSSYQSQPSRQQIGKFDVVRLKQRSQEIRGWYGHRSTLVTVRPIIYNGVVWCVKVPTGSFVAVRNGKYFVTGNSGMPKGLNISKAIDKAAGAEREIVGYDDSRVRPNRKYKSGAIGNLGGHDNISDRSDNGATITAPATAEAKQWEGWNTNLKPGWEPIVLARKPLVGTVAETVLKYGTGGINIDACRVPIDEAVDDPRLGGKGTWGTSKMAKNVYEGGYEGIRVGSSTQGRFPANLITDGSDEVVNLFPQSKGQQGDIKGDEESCTGDNGIYGHFDRVGFKKRNDTGSAARFFNSCSYTEDELNGVSRFMYCPKATKKERNGSKHPTIKPVSLLRWLVRLVTPPNGIVLDPFAGTGTTGEAAQLEGFSCILIEREPEYIQDIKRRLGVD